jgi:hypothetical protein
MADQPEDRIATVRPAWVVHHNVQDVTETMAAVALRRAEADEKIAEFQAAVAKSTYEAPAESERKRDGLKTSVVVGGILTIVAVAAFRLSGSDLAYVLAICGGALAAAWGVVEGVKAATKRSAPALPPRPGSGAG